MKNMKKNLISTVLAVCLILSSLTACSSGPNNSTAKQNNEVAKEKDTVSFTDSAGRTVEIPADIKRIAPTGTMAQMVIFALAPDELAGISSKWTNEAEQYIDKKYYNLPVLGQFYGKGDMNLEEIAKVAPQVIIDIGESKSSIVEDMDAIQKQIGIPTVHIEATTETMGEAYRMLGTLLGKKEEAEVLAKYCEEIYGKTQNIIKTVGENGKVNMIYCTGKDGLNVLAKGSFHAEILDWVSNNAAVVQDVSSKGTGNPVDMEQLIKWNPDVIIFAPGSIYEAAANDKAWQELKAIKNGKYYEVPSGPYNWMGDPPSVNRYMGMIWISQLLYPNEAKYNVYDEAARYYKLFYHCELSEEQYKKLIENSLLKSEK